MEVVAEVHGHDLEVPVAAKEVALDLKTSLIVVLSIYEEVARIIHLLPPRIPLLDVLVQVVVAAFWVQLMEVVVLASVLEVATVLLQDTQYACKGHSLRRLLPDPYSRD